MRVEDLSSNPLSVMFVDLTISQKTSKLAP